MKYSKLLVLLTPASLFVLFQFLIFKPSWLYFVLFFCIAIFLTTAFIFLKESKQKKDQFILFLLPIFFSLSILSYITISSKFTNQILVVINFVFIYFLLRNFYYYFFKIKNNLNFENFFSYGNLLTVFFVSASAFGIKYFLNTPTWIIILSLIPIFALILYSVVWVNKINIRDSLIFILLGVIVLTEILWTISFLPFNYNTLGLILAICYYVYIGVVRFFLKIGESEKMTIKLYLIFGFISILFIILTSKA
jgi:hypothetical protein